MKNSVIANISIISPGFFLEFFSMIKTNIKIKELKIAIVPNINIIILYNNDKFNTISIYTFVFSFYKFYFYKYIGNYTSIIKITFIVFSTLVIIYSQKLVYKF